MLISNRGTGGDADDRDVIRGSFGCPNLLNPFYLNHIFKYPRVWGQSPISANLRESITTNLGFP